CDEGFARLKADIGDMFGRGDEAVHRPLDISVGLDRAPKIAGPRLLNRRSRRRADPPDGPWRSGGRRRGNRRGEDAEQGGIFHGRAPSGAAGTGEVWADGVSGWAVAAAGLRSSRSYSRLQSI